MQLWALAPSAATTADGSPIRARMFTFCSTLNMSTLLPTACELTRWTEISFKMPLVPPILCLPYNHSHHRLMLITNWNVFICRPGSPTRPEASGALVPYFILFYTFYSVWHMISPRQIEDWRKSSSVSVFSKVSLNLSVHVSTEVPSVNLEWGALFCSDGQGSELPGRFSLSLLWQSWEPLAHSIALHLPTSRAQATSFLFATYNVRNLSTMSVNK